LVTASRLRVKIVSLAGGICIVFSVCPEVNLFLLSERADKSLGIVVFAPRLNEQ
jgi:hypothetical protein